MLEEVTDEVASNTLWAGHWSGAGSNCMTAPQRGLRIGFGVFFVSTWVGGRMSFQGSQALYDICNGHTALKLNWTLRRRNQDWQQGHAPEISPLDW